MKTRNLIVIGLFLLTFHAFAQEEPKKSHKPVFLNIVLGANTIQSEITEMDFIRGESPSYYNQGEASKNLRSYVWTGFLGVKAGLSSKNNKFRYWTGLRFTRLWASLGKDNFFSNKNSNFFYLLFRQTGTTTEFLKIKEISQVSDYLGIPIELNYFPFKPRRFQIGFKIGFELNYRLQTKTEVEFVNSAMNIYEPEVSSMVGNPGNFTAALYGGVKIHYGKPSRIGVSIETCTPSVFLTTEKKGISSPVTGYGLNLALQIPLTKSKP